ncbi:hypothetical protein CRENBAI_020125 [Crenichthys baileyi]|uniref:Uncharacterized protein n=1 Tax=Crenichthys baileyi TaxID=28760 RepID=A0AAV9SL43_9TELE
MVIATSSAGALSGPDGAVFGDRQFISPPNPRLIGTSTHLCCIPLTSSVKVRNSPDLTLHRQVEVPLWNETHPFPLSVARCCNDSREVGKKEGKETEEGKEEEEEKVAEMRFGSSQLCSCLMSRMASPPGTVCFPGKDGEVGQFV